MRRALATLALLALPAALQAQRLRGVVTEGDGNTPVAGAVVLLLDASGAQAARTLTNERGEYVVSAAAPGTHRLRVLRIGLTPTLTAPFPLATDATRNVALAGRPVQLQAIRITGRSECRVRPDSAQEAFRAWESVRTALTAAAITESARPLEVRRVLFRQRFSADGRKLLGEERSEASGMSRRPFTAAPSEQLDRLGYVVVADTGTVYFAPDAETLISDSFADAHCLRLVGAPADTGVRAQWIGVAFSPVAGRRAPDVEGTLWLDARTSELREIEYRYTNVPPVYDGSGRVALLRLPTGAWIVSEWSIRMPVVTRYSGRGEVGMPGAPSALSEAGRSTRTGVEVSGGDLVEVRDRGSLLWARVRHPLPVRVVQAGTDSGIAGAEVRVEGDGRRVRTGSDGRATIDSVLPGMRRVLVRLPLYDSLGLGEHGAQAQAGGSEVVIPVELSDRLLLPLCAGADSAALREAMLHGVVRDAATGAPVSDAEVRATWTASYRRVTGGLLGDRAEATTTTDSRGRYTICGVPRRKPVLVQATVPGVARGAAATVQVASGWRAAHDIAFTATALASAPAADTIDFVAAAGVRTGPAARQETAEDRGLRGFEARMRRRSGGGVFIGPEEIARRRPSQVIDLLRAIPGIQIVDSLGVKLVASTRSERLRAIDPASGLDPSRNADWVCLFGVTLDGRAQDANFPVDRIPIESVHGIEVYRGTAQMPVEFASMRQERACGMVIIWTRGSR